MFEHIREDLCRYGAGGREQLRAMILYPRVWAIAGHRFARWVYTAPMSGLTRRLLQRLVVVVNVWIDVATHIELPAGAEIGPGLLIPHSGYIVVGPRVRIGRHCTLTQGVTIGHGGGGTKTLDESPVIGDRVYIGPGAVIIGPVTVGDDAVIGAGAVVTRSIPARGVAVGNPARVISRKGSFDLIFYQNREDDPARQAALAALESESVPPHGLQVGRVEAV